MVESLSLHKQHQLLTLQILQESISLINITMKIVSSRK